MVVVLGASIFLLVDSRGDGATEVAAPAGEIFLEPANDDGQDPFTSNVAGEVFVPATTLPTPPSTAPPSGQTAVLSTSGTTPGLYGGTRDNARCDQTQMSDFLEQNADKAQAWADTQGIPTSELRSFISSLTPVQLRADTRVTNHGFRDGRATPKQSVLQSGTAVLVDETGVPRARCACGNPLLPPEPVAVVPSYSGDGWEGFEPQQLVVVQPGPAVEELTLSDFETGTPFVRPVGTAGESDVDAPPGTDVSDPLASGTAASTPSPDTTEFSTPGVEEEIVLSDSRPPALSEELRAQAASDDAEVALQRATVELGLLPGGELRGSFLATFETIEEGCTYLATFRGTIIGTYSSSDLNGTWSGPMEEQPVSGSCEGLITDAEQFEGTVTGTIDPDGPRVRGIVSLMDLPMLDFEVEARS